MIMAQNLSGKIALVTGSSRGIGKAIAAALFRDGATIILSGRDEENLKAARLELISSARSDSEIYCVRADATKALEIKNIFNDPLWGKLGKLDILVNNVGGPLKFGDFFGITDDDWLADWNFNFMSMVRFTREALPRLKNSGDGRVINISAVPARQPGEFIPQYAASKAAMLNLNKYLANTLAKDNILVNAICPNTLEGGAWEKNARGRAIKDGISEIEAAERMRLSALKKSPLQRMGTPEDVANLAVFLASDAARHITGTVISVDGGTTRSMI